MIDSKIRLLRPALALLAAALFLAGCESPEERAATYLEQAAQFYAEDNLVKAELEVKNALQIEPRNADARYLMARIAESRRDFPEMASNLRAAIEARPDFLDARLKLGTVYALGGATDLAREQLEEARKTAPDDAGVRILSARLLAANGELEAAAEELRAALGAEPTSTEALGLLASVTADTDLGSALRMVEEGIAVAEEDQPLRLLKIQLLQRAGQEAEVEAEYRALIADYPEETGFRYQLARYLASAGRTDEVETILEEIVGLQPDNVPAKLALIQYVAGLRGQEEALAKLRQFVADAPDAHELRIVLAQQLRAAGKIEEAVAEYERVIDAAGNEDAALSAKTKLASIRLAQGDMDTGEALVDEVLSVDSVNPDALLLRGAVRFDRDELRDAVSDLRTVLRTDPNNQEAQLLLARAHVKAEDFMLAKDAYRRAIEMNPANVQATMELFRILVNERELDEAEKLVRSRLEVVPDSAILSRSLISILVERRRYDDARKEADRLAAQPGNAALGAYMQGAILQQRDRHEDALAAFRRALEEKPLAREPLQGYVSSLIALERNAEAARYLEELSAANPDNLYVKTLLSQVLAGTGEVGAAREILESTLEASGDWLPAYTGLAGLEGGNVAAQIGIYERGLAAIPGSPELALLLGTAYERSGRFEDAISMYEGVLRQNPDLDPVRNNLASLLSDHRRDEDSLGRALELASDFSASENPAYLDTLGWIYYRLGEHDRAQPLLERAVEAAPQVSVLRYHLGMNSAALGKTDTAIRELEAALGDETSDPSWRAEAEQALGKLKP